jgi:hypothetical protein
MTNPCVDHAASKTGRSMPSLSADQGDRGSGPTPISVTSAWYHIPVDAQRGGQLVDLDRGEDPWQPTVRRVNGTP